MLLNVFKDDAFHFMQLTSAVNKLPYVPTRLGTLGWFETEGIWQPNAAIELQDNVLTLVANKPRGAPGAVKGLGKRTMKYLQPAHLPQVFSVMADEIANLRAFGKETEVEVASRFLAKKMAVCRRDSDVTIEWGRMGAVKGIVYDADGTTVIHNLFTEFGVAQTTDSWALSNNATKVQQKFTALKRLVEDKIGGTMMTGIRVLASAEWFDALVGHPEFKDAWRLWNQSANLRDDLRGGFQAMPGVIVEEYRGQVGAQRFVGANKAYAVPEGVPGLFKTLYAPANYTDAVNTEGLPFYAKFKEMDFDKGLEGEVQSNPLHYCTRPDAIVELTAT